MDRQARHTRKCKSKRRDGFRGHVAGEPETGLITGCEMTMAAGEGSSDAENGVKMAARDRFHGGGDAAAARPAGAAAQTAPAGEGTGSAQAAAAASEEPAAAAGALTRQRCAREQG